jgi:sugar (pentulose or hexulose) kinase
MLMLGIDVGSSFIKSAVLDLERGKLEFEKSCPTPDFIKTAGDASGGKREIPMEQVAACMRSLIEKSLASYPIKGIEFSVQMHGFMLFRENKKITEYVSWQDMRGWDAKPDAASRIKKIAGDKLLRRNGIELNNSHSLCPLYHIINEEKIAGPLQFSMMGDAIIRCLTGQVSPIHPTVAASSGLYDLEKNDWNRELINLLSLNQIEFPPVSDTEEPSAWYNGPQGKIPVYTAVGDHQAAVAGCGANTGDIIINIGTGGQMAYIDDSLCFGSYETRPFFSGRTLRALTDIPSGRNLSILMNLLDNIGKKIFCINTESNSILWERINKLAENAAGEMRPVKFDLAFFAPAGAAIADLGADNFTIGNLFAAAYQAIANAAFGAYKQLTLTGKPPRNIIGAGGVIRRTPLLQKMISDLFGMPLILSSSSEDVMLGLLRLGRWHAGLIPEIL